MDFTSAAAPSLPGTPAPKARVLVVGVDPKTRNFLTGVLEHVGYDVETAADERAAIESLRSRPADVLLAEPRAQLGEDGWGLLEHVAAERPTTVPVVVAGPGTVERTVEFMRAGAFDVLAKPCRANEIVATVDKALGHHRALAANVDLRQRLQVQDKLAMIGRLAAGVAHELNNPLDATLRCMRLLEDRVGPDMEARELMDMAHAGLLRMADIVQGLLMFSRNAQLEQAPEPLASVVESATQSVSLALGDAAPPFHTSIQDDAASTLVPRGLQQVLVNLLRNACDAAGRLLPIRVTARREGDGLRIDVCDEGPGMPPEVLSRVFEPFFTTKDPGRGTGLGLPISARLVERFGGRLELSCPPPRGTIATIFLPAAPAVIAAFAKIAEGASA